MSTLKILVNNANRIIGTRFDESTPEEGWIEVESYPAELLNDPFYWYYTEDGFIKMSPEEIQEEQEREQFYSSVSDIGEAKKLSLFIESIPTLPKPPKRDGYIWIPIYDKDGGCFGWEEVVDPYYVPGHKGTYTDPIPYVLGDTVTKYTNPDPFEGDGWYSYEGDVKVCIKSGVPADFDDEEYFAYSVD